MGTSHSQTKDLLLEQQAQQQETQQYYIYDHAVVTGDTLFSIAFKFGVSTQLLKSINLHLKPDGELLEGDVVFVPLKN